MAATTLVRSFLQTVCTTLQDSPQFSRWPERELVVYANFAQLAIAKYVPQAGSRVDAVRLQPGTKQDFTKVLAASIKPGDGTTPADASGIALLGMVRNMGSDGFTPGRVIRPVDSYTLDTNDPDWHTRVASSSEISAGRGVREFVHDRNMPLVAYVYPGVHASIQEWVEIDWMVEPKKIPDGGPPNSEIYSADGSNNALMSIQDRFIEDAVNYTVAMALLKGSKNVQNIPKSQYHAGLFITSINAQVEAITGTNPNLKMLPMADQVPAAG